MFKSFSFFLAMGIAIITTAQVTPPGLELVSFASGLSSPNGIYSVGDERLFILEKDLGEIEVFDLNGSSLGTFLDIGSRINGGGERGLLGMAFHPDYADNGYFYLNYTDNSSNTVIARYSVSPDPNVADFNSEVILLSIDQPFGNHNGGHIAFGSDGYLYIGMGDGGSANDPINAGQNPATLLGKMLRIDVDGTGSGPGGNYGIPPNNPFITDASVQDEIWSFGMRNPWKFSFDPQSGDLWIADVGQNDWEEVNFEPADSPGGLNYGWVCREGFHPNPNIFPCDPEDFGPGTLTDPITEYTHGNPDNFCSISGGVVYRGDKYPILQGHYIFTDYCNGRLRSIKREVGGSVEEFQLTNNSVFGYVAFGEDVNGDIYVANISNGQIYRLEESCGEFNPTISDNGDGSLLASSGVSYSWFIDGQAISGASGNTYIPEEAGSFYAEVDNGECIRETNSINWGIISGTAGCTYPEALNYEASAIVDDGTCNFLPPQGNCPSDLNADGVINSADLIALLADFGLTCEGE